MDKYDELQQLGRGAFGVVSLVQRKADAKLFVVKRMLGTVKPKEGGGGDGGGGVWDQQPDLRLEDVENEVRVLRKMQHPNITRYEESFLAEEGTFCIVQEYAEQGSLNERIAAWRKEGADLNEEAVLDAFVQLLLALDHVHAQNVLHRDIKPPNILIAAGDVYKLGDFGLSRVLANPASKAKSYCGTPTYMSPEVVEGRPYDARSDLWALGCVLYEMVMWKVAFDARSNNELVMQICTSAYEPIPMDRCSAQLRKLVCLMLSHMPADRPGIAQLLQMPIVASAKARFRERYAAEHPSSAGLGVPKPLDDSDEEELAQHELPARLQRAMSFDAHSDDEDGLLPSAASSPARDFGRRGSGLPPSGGSTPPRDVGCGCSGQGGCWTPYRPRRRQGSLNNSTESWQMTEL